MTIGLTDQTVFVETTAAPFWTAAETLEVTGHDAERAAAYARRFLDHHGAFRTPALVCAEPSAADGTNVVDTN